MFHPGMNIDDRLAQLYQAEQVAQATEERASRRPPLALPQLASRPSLLIAAASTAIIMLWIAWVAVAV